MVGVGWALAFSSLGHDLLAMLKLVGYNAGCRLWSLCRWVPRPAPSSAGLPAGDGASEAVHAASSDVTSPSTRRGTQWFSLTPPLSSGAGSSRGDSPRYAGSEDYVIPAGSPGKN